MRPANFELRVSCLCGLILDMKRQRIYLINRDFQLRYTGAAVAVGILSTVFTSFIVLFPLYQFEILKIAQFDFSNMKSLTQIIDSKNDRVLYQEPQSLKRQPS